MSGCDERVVLLAPGQPSGVPEPPVAGEAVRGPRLTVEEMHPLRGDVPVRSLQVVHVPCAHGYRYCPACGYIVVYR